MDTEEKVEKTVQISAVEQTEASQELAISLLDRYVSIVGATRQEISDACNAYLPVELDLGFVYVKHVSAWLKRERSIRPHHFPAVIKFIMSDDFLNKVPEARLIFRDQESCIEGAIYIGKLFGMELNPNVYGDIESSIETYWLGLGGGFAFFKPCKGYSFAVVHMLIGEATIGAPVSGYIFPVESKRNGLNVEGSEATTQAYRPFLWNRLKRQLISSPDDRLFFPIAQGNENIGTNRLYMSEVSEDRVIPDEVIQVFRNIEMVYRDEADSEYTGDEHYQAVREAHVFLENFIDNNVWNVIPDV